jgi:phosphoribosylglycinamide formyltransferase-1
MLTLDPMRVAVLCSGRAPGLLHLLARASNRVVGWDVVCCVTSEDAFEHEQAVAGWGVPIEHHPVRQFYATFAPEARLSDRAARAAYDAATVRLLQRYRPDLIVLAGYLLVLTAPMLSAYGGRIVNVHHSDLARRDASGGPRYPGLRAVRDAILAGERETRCTSHLVTAQLDGGPILARSEPFPVPDIARWALTAGEHDVLRRVIWAHQEWMLRAAFGPLMEQSLERMALQECAR